MTAANSEPEAEDMEKRNVVERDRSPAVEVDADDAGFDKHAQDAFSKTPPPTEAPKS